MALKAPTSEVAICNLALIMVKQPPVVQIDPITSTSTKAEELCNTLYQQVRRETLRWHTWNFALRRALIAPNAIVPLFEYERAYDLPNDFVRFVSRFEELGNTFVSGLQGVDYDIEDGQYLFNGDATTSLKIRYIFDATTVSKFDPLFIKLFSLNLAIELAPNFSASPAVKRDLLARQVIVETRAMAVDGQERPPTRKERSRWNQARKQGTSGTASRFTNFS